jgi:replicative DNA helicase
MLTNTDSSPPASAKKLTVWMHMPTTRGGCLAGDTLLVNADTGWPIKLRALVGRREGSVLTMRDASLLTPQRPTAYLAHEAAPLLRLTTYSGRSIAATAEQAFLTRDGWKPLSALCPSDAVAVIAEYPQIFGRGNADAAQIKLLAYLTANDATGDGAAPSFTDPDVRADFEAAVAAKEDECVPLGDESDPTRLYVRGQRGARSHILGYLDLVGVHGVRAPDRFVPNFVFGLRQDRLRLYLSRLFTCDGTVETSGRITYRTASLRMARDVQHLLARFGVVCLLRGLERDGALEAIELSITTKTDVVRFIDEIGFLGEKATRAEAMRAALYHVRMLEPPPDRVGPILFDRVYMVEALDAAPVYDLAVADTHNFVAGDFIVRTLSWASLAASVPSSAAEAPIAGAAITNATTEPCGDGQ